MIKTKNWKDQLSLSVHITLLFQYLVVACHRQRLNGLFLPTRRYASVMLARRLHWSSWFLHTV